MSQHTKPCHDCPFLRTTPPGALGGSPPATYIGQTEAGFMIPCHCKIDYNDSNWRRNSMSTVKDGQCAGAAIYRRNLDIVAPRPILDLPEDKEKVFASHEEFLSHHFCVSLDLARAILKDYPPRNMARDQLEKPEVMQVLVPKPAE